ncbi:MAG: type IV pilus secretin PilQ [Azonexus sp.]
MNFFKNALSVLTASFLVISSNIYGQNLSSNTIETINVAQQGQDIAIKIDLKEPISVPPAGFSIANPAKIAFDFSSTTNGLGKNSQSINEGDLRSLNIVQVGERTRLVLNLARNMNYTTRLEGKSLYVILTPLTGTGGSLAQRVTHFTTESLIGKKHSVHDVSFRRGRDGEARIVVDLSDSGTGIDIRQQGTSLVVEFAKTNLPEHLRRKLDVTDFGTPVTTVETKTQGDNTLMNISPKGLWEHNAYQSDNQFIIEVKKIVEDPNKLVQGTKIGYQGPRVSINYQNGDVRALLRLMAEELGLNAVISETVSGTTTLVLKDVPADQVVDIIFQQKALDMRKNGNVILIAPRDEIATKEKLEFESKQQIGELEPLRTEAFQINYQKAEALQKLLTDTNQRMLSKRGSAVVDARTNTLFINDTSTRLEDVRKVVSRVDVPVRQVMIEARIVEASDAFSRNLGVRLGYSSPYSQGPSTNKLAIGANYQTTGQNVQYISTDPVTGTQSVKSLVQGTPSYPLMQQVNLPATPRSGVAGALSFLLYNSSLTELLGLEITALEADGRGKIISSPRVMTADQVEALIEQGVEIPYQQATSSGATSVAFRKANLALKVKPQITPDGKITLTLDVNKDSPNPTLQTGSGVAIDTKHVKTEVLVDNGGTVVIGGIYTQSTKNQTQKLPWLGDIPMLGWLFKNNEIIDDKTELLIFITPKIVSEKLGMN